MEVQPFDSLTPDDKKQGILSAMAAEPVQEYAEMFSILSVRDTRLAALAMAIGIDPKPQFDQLKLDRPGADTDELLQHTIAKTREMLKTFLPVVLAELDLWPLDGL
jgi:malonyl CoA-acyl carrier protein transacylase